MNANAAIMRKLGLTALAGLLFLGLAVETMAQAADASGAIAVVPTSQIAARAQALVDRLDTIQAQRPLKALERIEPQIEELVATSTAAAERVEAVLSGPATPVEIEGQATRWKDLDRRFEDLQNQIRVEADALDVVLAEIDEQSALWKQTRSQARSTKAPEAVLQIIDKAVAALARAKKQVGGDLDSALMLLDRVYQAERRLRPTLERLEAAKTELAEGLWLQQDKPVWSAAPTWEEFAAVPGQIGSRLASIWQSFLPDLRRHRVAVVLQGLIFLVLAWLFSKTRFARAGREAAQENTKADALSHPWAVAYLASILMMPYLHIDDIRSFQLVSTPIALWAWYRALSDVVAPSLRIPVLGLALLAIPELFRFVLPGQPVVNRVLITLDLAVALAGLLWLRRPERILSIPRQAIGSPWLRILNVWMSALVPTLAVGLLAALLGYSIFADRIALFAIWGSVLGGAWAALVRITEEMTRSGLDSGGFDLLRMARTSKHALMFWVRRILRGLGLFAWVFATLTVSGLWSPAQYVLEALLSVSVGYGSVSISLGGILAFVLTLWLSWLLARFMSFSLDQEIFSRVRTAPGVSFALSTFARYAVLVFGFLVAMGAIGLSLDRVALLLSALGVGIGFGLQNVVANFVSGVILLFERPIRVGDWIQVDDLFGIVKTIGIRASKVRTFDGADVLVPNGDLIAARVTNWTLSDRKRRVVFPVGVAYGTPPRQVLGILADVARALPAVLADPEPTVVFRGFGDSSLDFEIRAWTDADWVVVSSDLAVAAYEALDAAGITIPFPQRDLHLRNIDELRDALQPTSSPARFE